MTGDTSPTPSAEDLRTLEALRAGDEAAFAALVDRYNAPLTRMAMSYVHDAAVAQEVTQEAWIGLLESLGRFEGRSSLKTWLFRILINCARSRARKESRTIAFSDALPLDRENDEPVDPARFHNRLIPGWGGHWREPPARWEHDPEGQALASETREDIRRSIAALPPQQREVIRLRDIEGCTADEACNALGVSDTNQRVLLHRARSAVRRALERQGVASP